MPDADGAVVVANSRLSRADVTPGFELGVEQPDAAGKREQDDGRRRDGDDHVTAEGEPREPLEEARPSGRGGGGELAHAVAQGRVGGGPSGLQLGDQVSGGHRLVPSPRVSRAPG